MIQKPAISSFDSANGPSTTFRLPPENLMRAPFELGCSPSPASITPALTSSSLNLPIAAKSSVLGSSPASVAALDLTITMMRIVESPVGPAIGARSERSRSLVLLTRRTGVGGIDMIDRTSTQVDNFIQEILRIRFYLGNIEHAQYINGARPDLQRLRRRSTRRVRQKEEIITAIKHQEDSIRHSAVIFDDHTGKQVDFDLSGSLADVLARESAAARHGPGRPKLGVVGREVSLLPRHWEWLEEQPNGISAALRRLVDEARKREPGAQKARRMRAALSRVMWAMAG